MTSYCQLSITDHVPRLYVYKVVALLNMRNFQFCVWFNEKNMLRVHKLCLAPRYYSSSAREQQRALTYCISSNIPCPAFFGLEKIKPIHRQGSADLHHWSSKLRFRLWREYSSSLHPLWTSFTLSPAHQNQFNSNFKREFFKVLVWKEYLNGFEPTSTHVYYS